MIPYAPLFVSPKGWIPVAVNECRQRHSFGTATKLQRRAKDRQRKGGITKSALRFSKTSGSTRIVRPGLHQTKRFCRQPPPRIRRNAGLMSGELISFGNDYRSAGFYKYCRFILQHFLMIHPRCESNTIRCRSSCYALQSSQMARFPAFLVV